MLKQQEQGDLLQDLVVVNQLSRHPALPPGFGTSFWEVSQPSAPGITRTVVAHRRHARRESDGAGKLTQATGVVARRQAASVFFVF